MTPPPTAPWPASALLLALLGGWGAVSWLASARLARRRGLTWLAAALDPRGWAAERIFGLPARAWLVGWPAGLALAWAALGRG